MHYDRFIEAEFGFAKFDHGEALDVVMDLRTDEFFRIPLFCYCCHGKTSLVEGICMCFSGKMSCVRRATWFQCHHVNSICTQVSHLKFVCLCPIHRCPLGPLYFFLPTKNHVALNRMILLGYFCYMHGAQPSIWMFA